MGKIFILITQLRNLTDRRIGFQVVGGYFLLPELPPRKTRMVKLSRILRFSRERGSDWKIRVFVDHEFSGIVLDPWVVLKYVRVSFRNETSGNGSDVLCVEAVPENCSDYFLRHKYIGCMRNIFWDDRANVALARSDSRLATKLREIEAYGRNWSSDPYVDTTLQNRAYHMQKMDNPHEENSREIKEGSDDPAVPNIGEEESMMIPLAPVKRFDSQDSLTDASDDESSDDDEYSSNTSSSSRCILSEEIERQPSITASVSSSPEPWTIPIPSPGESKSLDTKDSPMGSSRWTSVDSKDINIHDHESSNNNSTTNITTPIHTPFHDHHTYSFALVLKNDEFMECQPNVIKQAPTDPLLFKAVGTQHPESSTNIVNIPAERETCSQIKMQRSRREQPMIHYPGHIRQAILWVLAAAILLWFLAKLRWKLVNLNT